MASPPKNETGSIPSEAPPSPLSTIRASSPGARQDTSPDLTSAVDWPWEVPAATDFGDEATRWRAAKALARTERHKAELHQLRESHEDLRKSLDALRKTFDEARAFLDSVVRLLKWAGAIVCGALLTAGVGATIHWISTLHH